MRSMTGFGRGSASRDGHRVMIDISAVNSRKQVDVRVNLAREFAFLEPDLIKAVRANLTRGSLSLTVNCELAAEYRRQRIQIDADLAAGIVRQLRQLGSELQIDGELRLGDLLQIPGLIAETAPEPLPQLVETAMEALRNALAALDTMQRREGESLGRDLAARQQRLCTLLDGIRAGADQVLVQCRDRLRDRIRLLELELKLDDERLAREVAFLAERADVSEEIVRLQSHLDRVRELLAADDAPGRALEFLCQEMGREINTLCAKTPDTTAAAAALEFKTELGRVREQVQNIE